MRISRRTGLAALMLANLSGCGSPAPREIVLGVDACEHCHMTLADRRFAAQALTVNGKAYPFDDIACLAAFLRDGGEQARIYSVWVTEVTGVRGWIDARTATYLQRPDLSTPMASGLVAFASREAADSARQATPGALLSWDEVLAGAGGRPHHAYHQPRIAS